jgi:hypothetical protein
VADGAQSVRQAGRFRNLGEMESDDPQSPPEPPDGFPNAEPAYAPGDRVVVARGGVYYGGEVIPMESYWSDRTARHWLRVRLDDGRRLRVQRTEIVQRAE